MLLNLHCLSLPQHGKDGSNQPQMLQLSQETTNEMMKCTAISVYIRVDDVVKKSRAESSAESGFYYRLCYWEKLNQKKKLN